MSNVITVFRHELEHGLRHEGFTTRKIEQFVRIFNAVESSQGDMLELDSTRAMLVNVNGTEQGLCLSDFITAWWVYWVVVFNQSTDAATHHQALGAIRALFFVSASVRDTSQKTTMQMWWRDCEPIHGHPTLEAMLMQYAAVMLCPDGGIIRHETTLEVANVLIGNFDTLLDAMNQACRDLDCSILHPARKGIISKGRNRGGYMLVTTQELATV